VAGKPGEQTLDNDDMSFGAGWNGHSDTTIPRFRQRASLGIAFGADSVIIPVGGRGDEDWHHLGYSRPLAQSGNGA
jgi:hypothetical protein